MAEKITMLMNANQELQTEENWWGKHRDTRGQHKPHNNVSRVFSMYIFKNTYPDRCINTLHNRKSG